MNILETYAVETPYGNEDICPKFTIDDILNPFVLHNITTADRQYSFSVWVRSEAEGGLLIHGNSIPTSTEWSKHSFTFTAKDENFDIYFRETGVYYLYHPQLENGNKSTDWSKSPDDIDDSIQQVKNSADDANNAASSNTTRIEAAEALIDIIKNKISMFVTDADGTSLWEQTSDGWTFSTADVQKSIEEMQQAIGDINSYFGNVDSTIEALRGAMENMSLDIDWIKTGSYQGEPCLALGETSTDFRLLITNTRIVFWDGSDELAWFTNQAMNIKKAVIQEELQQGPFVWKIRSSGNMGLLWKGVTN